MTDLRLAKQLVHDASTVAVLTGAGISTGAGIPDFRGPEGLWTKDPKAELVSNIDAYLSDPHVRKLAWLRRISAPTLNALPTPAHQCLVDFEKSGKLSGILTQNTDGLHLAAGSDPDLVLELHGNTRTWRCQDCQATGPFQEMVDRISAGEDDPHCLECGGITRADVVLFGESLDAALLKRAWAIATECDLLIAVGSTLVVEPVASLVRVTSGAVIICNDGETGFDRTADVCLAGDIQQVLPSLLS